MNTDRLTSWLGLIVGTLTGGTMMSQAPAFSKLWWAGLAVALGIAAWGYLTNKTVWPK